MLSRGTYTSWNCSPSRLLKDFKHHLVQAWEGGFYLKANSNLIVLSQEEILVFKTQRKKTVINH